MMPRSLTMPHLWLPRRRRGMLAMRRMLLLERDPIQAALQAAARAYYPFEADGTDATPYANDLTEVNSPTYAAGKVGNAAQLVLASSQYFTHAAPTGLGNLTSLWVWFWASLASKPAAAMNAFSLANNAASADVIAIRWVNTTDRWRVVGRQDDATNILIDDTQLGATTLNQLDLIQCWIDGVGMTLNMQINDLAVESLAMTLALQEAAPKLFVGSNRSGAVTWDGRLDEVGIVPNYVPTAADRAWLYNSGSGRSLF